MDVLISRISAICITACIFAAPGTAAALECAPRSDPKVSTLAGKVLTLLPKGLALGEPDLLDSSVTLLREHGMAPDAIVNHLISLYCPAVSSEGGLSADQKTDKVRQFAQKVTAAVGSERSVEALLFKVPLSPGLAEVVQQRARQASVSPEQWIANAVASAVQ